MKLVNFLLIGYVFVLVNASYGDVDPNFVECLDKCKTDICENDPPTLPLTLQMTFWSCEADCKYNCMFEIVREREESGEPITQYYGKWPFYRFLGMQEPASVIFSFLNFIMHYRGLKMIKRIAPRSYHLRKYYVINAMIGLYSWVASMIFHTRDNKITEKMDYFGASGTIIYSLFLAIVRTLSIRSKAKQYAIGLLIFIYYLGHISYLSFWKFDYGYNMKACTVIGVTQYALWLYWAYKNRYRPYTKKIVITILLMVSAMMLELNDFSPFFYVFDAHSLWHLCTGFILPLYYDFFLSDIRWETRKGKETDFSLYQY